MRRSQAACDAVSCVTAHAAAVQQRDFSHHGWILQDCFNRGMHIAVATLCQCCLPRGLVLVVFCRCLSCSSSYSRSLDIQVFQLFLTENVTRL